MSLENFMKYYVPTANNIFELINNKRYNEVSSNKTECLAAGLSPEGYLLGKQFIFSKNNFFLFSIMEKGDMDSVFRNKFFPFIAPELTELSILHI